MEAQITKGRLINISNRLPIKIVDGPQGIDYCSSEGGLASALKSVFTDIETLWIGWPGMVVPDEKIKKVEKELNDQKLHPVFLTQKEIKGFYEGFSNESIWPLFHYFPSFSSYKQEEWDIYQQVNKKFANEILKFATDNDTIWIHDYHLLLLPDLIRKELPNVTIGFFNHIPFPSYEIFIALPWRREVLKGLLGADIIGFQTSDDVKHFNQSCKNILHLPSECRQRPG